MAINVISGALGSVNAQATVRRWSIVHQTQARAYRASNTGGAEARTAGLADWSGFFGFYGHTPGALPGAALAFVGHTGAQTASGTAIVDRVELVCDIAAGGLVEGTAAFSGNGALTLGAGSAADATAPDPPPAVGCKAAWAGSDMEHVRRWSLTLSADNRAYASSGTSGQMRRVAGAIDAEATVSVFSDALDALPAVGDTQSLALYVDATDHWALDWMLVERVEPLVEIESGEPVGAQVRLRYTGYREGLEGSITAPGAGQPYWP